MFTTHSCHMWVVPEVAIVNLCWNMPWGGLLKGLDYVCTEWISSNIIVQMQGKPRRVNQSLTESKRRNFRTTFAILPGEYPCAAVRNKRLLLEFAVTFQNYIIQKIQNYRLKKRYAVCPAGTENSSSLDTSTHEEFSQNLDFRLKNIQNSSSLCCCWHHSLGQ